MDAADYSEIKVRPFLVTQVSSLVQFWPFPIIARMKDLSPSISLGWAADTFIDRNSCLESPNMVDALGFESTMRSNTGAMTNMASLECSKTAK